MYKYAYVPLVNIQDSDFKHAFYILSSDSHIPDSPDLRVHRYFDKGAAIEMFEKLQSAQNLECSKFGLIVHSGKIIARYGDCERLENVLKTKELE